MKLQKDEWEVWGEALRQAVGIVLYPSWFL